MTKEREALKLALQALYAGPSTLHTLPLGEECKCSQCEFVRLRKSALGTINKVLAQPEHKRKEFENVVRPMIEWLNVNWHPHVTVVITPTRAELSVGEIAYATTEFIRG